MAAIAGTEPFIFKPDGVGWLFAPSGAKDGPLPAHYEPIESPVGNLPLSAAAVHPRRAHVRRAAATTWRTSPTDEYPDRGHDVSASPSTT